MVGFPDLGGDFPAVQAALQRNVGDEGFIVFEPAAEQGQSFLTRRKNVGRKPAFGQRVLDDALNGVLVLDDEDYRQLGHYASPTLIRIRTPADKCTSILSFHGREKVAI